MGFLQEHGVKLSYAPKIFSLYAEEALARLREDPYVLAVDWPGTGFVIADTIARHRGADLNDPLRIAACLANTVDQFVADGNVYAPEDKLISRCEKLFGIDNVSAQATLDGLQGDGTLIVESTAGGDGHRAVYPTAMHEAETALANRLRALHTVPSLVPDMDAGRIVAEIVERLSIHLSEEQAGVLAAIIHRKVAILTGGPGTGKTTLVRAITVLSEALGREVVLAAPTGRAARRLGGLTQRNAYTIHRLLGWNPVEGLLERDRDNPIEADVIIVDEASMVDLMLMHYLVEAIPMASSLILVGDIHQLPPVGPGNVLEEMMRSGVVETFSLTEVFRQAMESPIIVNAHRVRNGEIPLLPRADGADELSEFYFVEARSPDHAVDTVVELCTRLIPRHFKLDPKADIQVLTPMHKGTAGTINLNKVLQATLNPHPEGEDAGAARFHPGDKVIHLKNNYRKDVYNGDIGLVDSVDPAAGRLHVDYDGRLVEYLFEELHELSLAYAITVHKSQGSEYPCAVVLLMTQHYPMLQRNLLYSAMTRGKELVVIVGMQRALATALKNDRPARRRSRLSERLAGLVVR
jgi:exodeoxyribonuclease V alpha subunit